MIKKNINRQGVLNACVDFSVADLVAGSAADAIDLPVGAIVVGGDLVVKEAFNSTSSDTLTIGDAGAVTRYLPATSIHATGRTELVPTGFVSTGDPVRVVWASGGGTPTTGKARLSVQYVIEGRGTSTFG